MKPRKPRDSSPSATLRCAIYTRKSSEEGLEQSFNSLHAQREAYICSQAGEGWILHAQAYDDGGFSGGNMERPGLAQLLADVEAGKIDAILVYKVDRLTRSLMDFARIVERLDERNVSFVSVTQAFNTTSSMGRLTLNMLLSFAQFEREVTGERIRDKIAASKARGMWMGGGVPLGYDLCDRKLTVNEAEADQGRDIYLRHLRLGSVPALAKELHREGIRSKRRTTQAGKQIGGSRIVCGALYHMLQNRLYIGEIAHRGEIHAGEHASIVERDMLSSAAEDRGPVADRANAKSLRSSRLYGGPSRNRTGVRGFAVPYVTTPPSGLVRCALGEGAASCQPLAETRLSTNGGGDRLARKTRPDKSCVAVSVYYWHITVGMV